MNASRGVSALNAIQRPNLPPLPPAIRSSIILDAQAPSSANAEAPTGPNVVAAPPAEVQHAVEAPPEPTAYDPAESLFPPTAAEMAAMADTKAKTDAYGGDEPKQDKKKRGHELAPNGYAAKAAFSMVLKTLGLVLLAMILVGGFLFWNNIKDTSRVTQLAEGTCVADFFTEAEGEFRNVFLVNTTDCINPHAYEVFSVSEIVFSDLDEQDADGDYAGIEETFAIGQVHCQAMYDEFVGGDFDTSPWQVWTFVPTEDRWEGGDRRVQCLVGDAAGVNLTEGTLRDAGRS